MRETFEFRVDEDFADRLFRDDEGKKLGSIRLVLIPQGDPKLDQIGRLQREINAEFDSSFFYGWCIRRQYSQSELSNAEAFKLWPKQTFEPAGEECGTTYDESTACPHCGAGSKQVSGLILDLRKAPKTKDIARTIAGETIVSQRFAELLIDGGFTGFELRSVRHKARYEDDPIDLRDVPSGRELLQNAADCGIAHGSGEFDVWVNRVENFGLFEQALRESCDLKRQTTQRSGEKFPRWYQLIPTASVGIVEPTLVGIEPFDMDPNGEHRCPRGDTIGLNLLSGLSVSRKDFSGSKCDVACTKQYIGVRRGLLRPEQSLVISSNLRHALEENAIKGMQLEVAYLR